MTLSDELNVKFMESIEAVGMGIGFRILVLQSGAWPLGQSAVSNFHIPQALQGSIHAFEGFYEKCHSGRKLNWMHHLGMVGSPYKPYGRCSRGCGRALKMQTPSKRKGKFLGKGEGLEWERETARVRERERQRKRGCERCVCVEKKRRRELKEERQRELGLLSCAV